MRIVGRRAVPPARIAVERRIVWRHHFAVQLFDDVRDCPLIESFALGLLGRCVGIVGLDCLIGIARRFHRNSSDLRSALDDLIVGERRRSGDRVHVDALDVRGPRVVAVRRRNGESKIDNGAPAFGDEIGGSGGQLDERRQRRAFLAACGDDAQYRAARQLRFYRM
jgi:hypothetical protein